MSGQTQEISSIEQKLHSLEVQIAERKPIEELVKVFVYFLLAISVVVGLFGVKQFSDIREMVSNEVTLQFPRDSKKFLDYTKLVNDTADLHLKFQKLYGKYGDALDNLSNLDKVTDDFDIEGKVARVMEESTARTVDGTLLDEEWRLEAISVLRVLAAAQEKKNFDSDFIFNAAQSASRLQQQELAYELMKTAYGKKPTDAPIKAGMLSAIVDIGAETDSEDAFSELMQMVTRLTPNSPHIVLSEAWNAVEDRRRYQELIGAINNLAANPDSFVPSYAHFLKARAYLRSSRPGDLQKAKAALKDGIDALRDESILSVWFESSLELLSEISTSLEKGELIREEFLEGLLVSESDEVDVGLTNY